MPNIGPQDWQQVAIAYAQENIILKAQLAATIRMLNAMKQASPNGTPAEVKEGAQSAAVQEEN